MTPETQSGSVVDAKQFRHQLMQQGTVLYAHDDVVGALVNFK